MSHQALARASAWSAFARVWSVSAARRSGRLATACSDHLSLENDVAELQGPVDVEGRSQAVGAGRRAQRGLRRFQCCSRIRGVPLEGEALDFDPRQLERSEISLVDPQTLKALGLIECLEVFLGEGQRRPGDQRAVEGSLDGKNGLPAHVLQLVAGHSRRRLGGVDAPLALAAQLDRLADGHGVLCIDIARPELLGGKASGRIRAQSRGRLGGLGRLDLRFLGAHGRTLAGGESECIIK